VFFVVIKSQDHIIKLDLDVTISKSYNTIVKIQNNSTIFKEHHKAYIGDRIILHFIIVYKHLDSTT
jgi:hypothetical protein